MGNYNLLHARNELAHNNHMMLQASGTLCLWMTYCNNSELDLFLSTNAAIASNNNITIANYKLTEGTPEELHLVLMEIDLELFNVIVIYQQIETETQLVEQFIGQEYLCKMKQETITVPNTLCLQLTSAQEKSKWEDWLVNNAASHQIEYYEPGMD